MLKCFESAMALDDPRRVAPSPVCAVLAVLVLCTPDLASKINDATLVYSSDFLRSTPRKCLFQLRRIYALG